MRLMPVLGLTILFVTFATAGALAEFAKQDEMANYGQLEDAYLEEAILHSEMDANTVFNHCVALASKHGKSFSHE